MRRALAALARLIRANVWEIVGFAGFYAILSATGWSWLAFIGGLVLMVSSYASGLFAGVHVADALPAALAPTPTPKSVVPFITPADRTRADLADRRILWEIEDAFNQQGHA